MAGNFFQTISKEYNTTFNDSGSKFIAFAFPCTSIDDFKQKMLTIKTLHPKATHVCYAYKIGIEKNIIIKSSDAGEPNGSAGKPILNQILSKELTNIGIIVVRYFGGTLLGMPKLINAYKNIAAMVLQISLIEKKTIVDNFKIICNYDHVSTIIIFIKKHNGIITKKNFNLFNEIFFQIPKNESLNFINKGKIYFHNIEIQKI